tara:strand:- start:189 stop:719 length:531 start_codon:yes stop_codon:yes gene_type:complete
MTSKVFMEKDKLQSIINDATPSEKYIIELNQNFQSQIFELTEKLNIEKQEKMEIENDLERTEKGKVYMKGLLHNLSEENKIRKKICDQIFSENENEKRYFKLAPEIKTYIACFLVATLEALIYTRGYLRFMYGFIGLLVGVWYGRQRKIYNFKEEKRQMTELSKTFDPLSELIDES